MSPEEYRNITPGDYLYTEEQEIGVYVVITKTEDEVIAVKVAKISVANRDMWKVVYDPVKEQRIRQQA